MFPTPGDSPYLIAETQNTIRHSGRWPQTPAAPMLKSESLTSSTHGRMRKLSFVTVPSDLSGEWECIQRRESDHLSEPSRLNEQGNTGSTPEKRSESISETQRLQGDQRPPSWLTLREMLLERSDRPSEPALTLREILIKESRRRGDRMMSLMEMLLEQSEWQSEPALTLRELLIKESERRSATRSSA